MAPSLDSDHLDPHAGLRIAPMGFRHRREQRRAKSEDLRDAHPYQAVLEPSSYSTARGPPRSPTESSRLRTKGLNIQFGLSPIINEASNVSPRLEGDEWEVIEERTQLMTQLHTLQAEIVQLARRDNERIGVSASSSPHIGESGARRRGSGSREWPGSSSFSSSDTLYEEDPEWSEVSAMAVDSFNEGERHLVMNAADLQKLREFRSSTVRYHPHEGPSVGAALQQIFRDFVVLGRTLLRIARGNALTATATILVLLAMGAYHISS